MGRSEPWSDLMGLPNLENAAEAFAYAACCKAEKFCWYSINAAVKKNSPALRRLVERLAKTSFFTAANLNADYQAGPQEAGCQLYVRNL